MSNSMMPYTSVIDSEKNCDEFVFNTFPTTNYAIIYNNR